MSSPAHKHRRWPLTQVRWLACIACLVLAGCDFGVDPNLTKNEPSDAGVDAATDDEMRCETDAGDSMSCEPVAVDPIWGCLGKTDLRTSASNIASFKVKVLYGFAQSGALETGVRDLSVRICQFGDVLCQNAVSEQWSYGSDNFLVIKGLESGLNYKIQLQAHHPETGAPLLPVEYLMYRTVVGDTIEPKPILMYEAAVLDALATVSEVKQDPELGMALLRIFDCSDRPLSGVQVSAGRPIVGCEGNCPTTVFYQNVGSIPEPGATQTDTAGRAGIFNLRPDVYQLITLTRTNDNATITTFVVAPRPGVLTYLHMWPWDYGTGAD